MKLISTLIQAIALYVALSVVGWVVGRIVAPGGVRPPLLALDLYAALSVAGWVVGRIVAPSGVRPLMLALDIYVALSVAEWVVVRIIAPGGIRPSEAQYYGPVILGFVLCLSPIFLLLIIMFEDTASRALSTYFERRS